MESRLEPDTGNAPVSQVGHYWLPQRCGTKVKLIVVQDLNLAAYYARAVIAADDF
jgi:hypothetical protein